MSPSYGFEDPRMEVSTSANWSFGGGGVQPAGPRPHPGGAQLRRLSPPSLPRRESLTSPMKGGNPIGSYQVSDTDAKKLQCKFLHDQQLYKSCVVKLG